jgi:hypothetical protein
MLGPDFVGGFIPAGEGAEGVAVKDRLAGRRIRPVGRRMLRPRMVTLAPGVHDPRVLRHRGARRRGAPGLHFLQRAVDLPAAPLGRRTRQRVRQARYLGLPGAPSR